MKETITFASSQAIHSRQVARIAHGVAKVALDPSLQRQCQQSEDLLQRHQANDALIYGINSGFGPLAGFQLPDADALTLQRNLIYHLATGVGEPFDIPTTRAIMGSRLASLTRGYSAVPLRVLEILRDCLNSDVIPVVPSLGTVGASGDLTPLAHIALALIGEGKCWHNGKPAPASEVLTAAQIQPLEIRGREGLALVNGVSAMTGLAALNQQQAEHMCKLHLLLGFGIAEALGGQAQAYSPLLGQARPHPGQQKVHTYLNEWAQSSQRLSREAYKLADKNQQWQPPHQDPYSLRCLPQIYGAIFDVLANHQQTVNNELLSASDNPLFFSDQDQIIHGGNFYGQHIAFAADSLTQAVLKAALHIERSISRLCHPLLQNSYPAFLNPADPGLHSGLMGAQVTATAVVAHMRGLAVPMATQTIPTNGDNQDVVSMGTLAAIKCQQVIAHSYQISAIASIALAQAMDLSEATAYSHASQYLYRFVRKHVAALEGDRPLSDDIQNLAIHLPDYTLPN